MRSNLIGMCSAVASVAVAGSAMAGVIYDFSATFDTGTAITGQGAPILDQTEAVAYLNGAAFPEFTAVAQQTGSRVSGSAGSLTMNFGAVESSSCFLMFANYSGTDLSGTTSFAIGVSAYAGEGTAWLLSVWDLDQRMMMVEVSSVQSNGTIVFSDFQYDWNGYIDWSRIERVELGVTRSSFENSDLTTVSMTSFEAVPAPGAIALLGTAGLMGRRRRN
jgi:hypothetical protein